MFEVSIRSKHGGEDLGLHADSAPVLAHRKEAYTAISAWPRHAGKCRGGASMMTRNLFNLSFLGLQSETQEIFIHLS
jgi:hypothetical protein